MTSIVLIGTCDTKLQELLHLRQLILEAGGDSVTLIDVGRSTVKHEHITVTQDIVTGYAEETVDLHQLPRGEVIKHMINCATKCVTQLYDDNKISAIISAGGSGGSSLATAVMREAVPIGFPKFMISTVASGATGGMVGETDITMMYSVVDIAGTNSLLHQIFRNAAAAVVGMSRAWQTRSNDRMQDKQSKKKRIGITMFGVTTPGVDAARRHLEANIPCEIFVFHATGHGGKAMERLVNAKQLDAVLDLTTTEVCDLLMGGNMSAGPNRLEAAVRAGIPYIVSAGALDMVNFPEKAMVPPKYSGRKLYEHNPTVTLMRTSADESREVAKFIAGKLKAAKRPELVQFVIPAGGVSIISTPGAAFADADADEALFSTLTEQLQGTKIEVVRDGRSINDEGFARDIAQRLIDLIMAM